ncbi:MAG: sugar transferase [Nanoarchaeota archaeon]|nr:sugar transferase [Nanoarchaeota archaeon]
MIYKILKRLFDIFFSALFLILLSPLLVIIALLILIFSGRPVMFFQDRSGLRGKRFKLYKFRTLIVNAREFETMGKVKKELQTDIGKILRPIHLDELPQLWNILKGDMSFVGWRPRSDLKEFPFLKDYKPGLTGLMSVIYYLDEKRKQKILRCDLASEDCEELYHNGKINLFYAQHMSFWLDIRIIYWTFILELENLLKLFKKQ